MTNKRIIKQTGGWQMNVDVYNDYVIKYPKTKKEIIKEIAIHLKHVGKEDQLQSKVKEIQNSIKESAEIIKNSPIPKKYLCDVIFLDKYKIKQTKVVMLEDILKDSTNMVEIKKIIKKYIQFVILLWKYGIHENTYKIHSNFGVINSQIVLVDLFEITNSKKSVISQIKNKKWTGYLKYPGEIDLKIINYFIEQANKIWTEEKLNEVWESKLSKN